MSKNTGCKKTFVVLAIENSDSTKDKIETIFNVSPQKIKSFGNRMPENALLLTTESHVQSTDLIEHLMFLLSTYDEQLDDMRRLNNKVKFFTYWESEHGNGGPYLDEDLL